MPQLGIGKGKGGLGLGVLLSESIVDIRAVGTNGCAIFESHHSLQGGCSAVRNTLVGCCRGILLLAPVLSYPLESVR